MVAAVVQIPSISCGILAAVLPHVGVRAEVHIPSNASPNSFPRYIYLHSPASVLSCCGLMHGGMPLTPRLYSLSRPFLFSSIVCCRPSAFRSSNTRIRSLLFVQTSSIPRNWFGTALPTAMPHSTDKIPANSGPLEPRKLVLCFDGTGNVFQGNTSDTNIVKLYDKFDRKDPMQYHYYQSE